MSVLDLMPGLALSGTSQSEDQVAFLNDLPLEIPEWFMSALRDFPLAGSRFSLTEEDDQSEMGVEFRWMSPRQIATEVRDAQPGKAAAKCGYLPIGQCLEGSGDPYFLRVSENAANPAIVRIPHDSIGSDGDLLESDVEVVAGTLAEFLSDCSVE